MERFDDVYGKVYDENGEFLFGYYECGIDSSMPEAKKMKLVEKREDSLYQQNMESELQQRGLI